MEKKFCVIFSCMILILCFCGCSTTNDKNTDEKNIQDFIENVFTVPYKGILEVAKSDLHLTDMDEYDKQIRDAIASLCGDNADTEKLADPSSRFYEQVIFLHLRADYEQYSITVDHVEVRGSEDNDTKYSYEAILIDSRESDPVTITGSIQLNDEHKIEYMSVN